MKATTTILSALALASTASASVVYSTAGTASYSYSAANIGALPPASDATLSNITVARYSLFPIEATNVTGLTNVGGTIGTATFHFQAGSGLEFSNDVNLWVGTGRNSTGSVVASYSYDNSTWTQWGINSDTVDKVLSADNVAAGQTDLYVRFEMNGNATGDTVITWGGGPNERPFTLNGTVVAVPEPSSLALLGLGGLALLRRRR